MNLTNYIVFHNQDSYTWFIEHNPKFYKKFKYIMVGNIPLSFINEFEVDCYLAEIYPNNIEQYPSLLTFTAWHLIANNGICFTDYVGIFEYDVIFKDYIHTIEDVKQDTIYGFLQRKLPDPMYLKVLPELTKSLDPDELIIAEQQPYWNTTSNFIMPMEFLKKFVKWYADFAIFHSNKPKISHWHERLINLYAAIAGYKNETIDLIEHKQLCSHGVQL